MPSSSPCLVWDFFRLFSGSAHHNSHIVPLWVRQNTCQEWSRLITVPVRVGGPLVTQCITPILSLMQCFWSRKLLRGPLQLSTQVFQHQNYFSSTSLGFNWDELACYICYLLGCACLQECSHTAITPPQTWIILARRVTHSRVPLTWGHIERFDVKVCVCVCVCEDDGMQISYPTR